MESLTDQLTVLEAYFGSGGYNSATTRVLSLAMNPESRELGIRQGRLSKLEAENRRLRLEIGIGGWLGSRGKILGKGEPSVVPLETYQVLTDTVQSLTDKLEEKEKRLMRTQEVS